MAPRFLTPVQKSFRVETCSELLAIYSATPDNKLSHMKRGFTTGIQTPSRVDTVETRQLSSAQEVPHSTVGWKVMTTIFWDCKGVLLVDYIPQKTIMTGPYYREVLTNLR